MSYVTPVMAVLTAFLSLALDPWDEFRSSSYFDSSWHIMRSCLLMLFGGMLAFFMVKFYAFIISCNIDTQGYKWIYEKIHFYLLAYKYLPMNLYFRYAM